LTDWDLTALSAQIAYIVPLYAAVKKSEINQKVDKCCKLGTRHTINHYNK